MLVLDFGPELIKQQSYHHLETGQLICRANLTGFYMMTAFEFNKLIFSSLALVEMSKYFTPY